MIEQSRLVEWLREARQKGVRMNVSAGKNFGEIVIRNVNGEVGETTVHKYGDAIAEFLDSSTQYSGECIDSLMSTVERMEKKAS